MGLSPGDRIDRYEVLEFLGAGGMGEVYRARDPKLARLVALKILHVDGVPASDGPARLLREARAAAALSHPNVLAIFDVGEVQEPEALRGLAYIAMELVEGTSLRAYIGDGSVPLGRRAGWLRDVATALGAAHRAGIVHRDVKPENVMISEDGVVKVLDFGIARRVMTALDRLATTAGQSLPISSGAEPSHSTMTEPGKVIGTPYYMAPEQIRGEAIDGRADQFAWGVVAYELLTGVAPWKKSGSALPTVSEILSVTPTAPMHINAEVQRASSDTIMRALSKQRADRFPTMEALLAGLDQEKAHSAHDQSNGEDISRKARQSLARGALSLRQSRGSPVLLARSLFGATAVVLAIASLVTARRAQVRANAPTSAGAGSDHAGGGCTSNHECVAAHKGDAWRCHSQKHVCVTISSEDCVAHAEPEAFEAEDTVWFGGMFPVTEVPAFVDESWAAELAREDFAQALGPSAERTGALHARPIGLLVCDEVVDAMRAARHMVDDVEVPAVIGFRSTKKALTTIPSVFLPNHVLSFISISQAAAVTKIPEPAGEPRLIWRSTLNHAAAAEPLAHLISDVLEPASRSAQRDLGKRPFRVAILLPKAANPDIAQSFFAVLRFNDRSALENGANFRQVIYEPRVKGGADDAIAELLAFSPNVIVVAGGPDPFTEVLMPLEARWSSSARPFYLAESGFPVHPVAELVGHDPALRRRFLSATNLSTTMTNAQLVLRYNLAFPAEPVSRSNAPQPSYDAFYLLAYAAYALGDGRISGTQLSGAIARLVPPGRRVDVGPTQIFEAFAALRAPEGRMDLNGAIGALDFDPSTGEAPIDYAITCPGVDDQGVASAGIDSGLVFDSRAKKLIGVLRCP